MQIVDSDDPCTTAAELFEREAVAYAELFAAARIAALEIDGNYDAAVHDSWFAGFDWQAFTDEELQLVTPIVALVSADYLAGDGLPAFSRLLGSRLPVHVLSWVRAYDNPGVKPGDGPFDCVSIRTRVLRHRASPGRRGTDIGGATRGTAVGVPDARSTATAPACTWSTAAPRPG